MDKEDVNFQEAIEQIKSIDLPNGFKFEAYNVDHLIEHPFNYNVMNVLEILILLEEHKPYPDTSDINSIRDQLWNILEKMNMMPSLYFRTEEEHNAFSKHNIFHEDWTSFKTIETKIRAN